MSSGYIPLKDEPGPEESRRFLCAIKTLAQVRRLQSGIPGSQTNVQINLSAAQSGSQQGEEPNS